MSIVPAQEQSGVNLPMVHTKSGGLMPPDNASPLSHRESLHCPLSLWERARVRVVGVPDSYQQLP